MNIIQVAIPRSNWGGSGTNQKQLIVMHWVIGEQSACDATFQNPARQASAHYSVGSDGTVHQYVQDNDVAWHAGPTVNYKSIGIEHAGGQMIGDTRKKPTTQCHDASAQLVADLCRKYNISCDRNHIRKHSEYMNTECPGSLDIDYIIARANSIINNTPMVQFDFVLKKVGKDMLLDMNTPATGKFVTKDKITGEVTDTGNILSGTMDKIVSPNCTKRLYEVTFNGVSRTLDLRDTPPVENTCEKQLIAANQKISSLEAQEALLKSQVAQLTTDIEVANKLVASREFEIGILDKTIKEKEEVIVSLRKVAGIGLFERALNWFLSKFSKK